MALRSLCNSSQAVLYDPMPSLPWSCRAEMPFECVATRWAAKNQVRRGRWVLCMMVWAMTEVCFRQGVSTPSSSAASPPHSHTQGLPLSFQPFWQKQCGQMKPSGQRFLAR